MKIFRFLLLGLLVSLPQIVLATSDLEFIVDLSGSMRKKQGELTQFQAAQAALAGALKKIPEGSYVAVRVYGHRIEQSDKAKSCQDTEAIFPLAPVNPTIIQQSIAALSPKGYTPMAYALQQAQQDFDATRENDRVIILLSDGEETCDGDPAKTVTAMKSAGFNVTVHTIGFNVGGTTRQQLEAIAAAGGGGYYDAHGPAALEMALETATKESLVIKPNKQIEGTPTHGGKSYETAVPLKTDTTYRLDHHQKIGFFDYFYVDLVPGKEFNLVIQTLEQGISMHQGQVSETNRPYAGAELHNGARTKLKAVNITGQPNQTRSLSYTPQQAGRYYILIGSTYDSMNKDHVSFTAQLIVRGDLNTDTDAGESLTQAAPIDAKRYTKNFLGGSDLKDVFAFKAHKDETYFVGIIPDEDNETYFKMSIFDSYKQKVLSQSSGVGEGMRSQNFRIPEDGIYYLELTLGANQAQALPYILELKQVDGVSKAPEPKKSVKKKRAKKVAPKTPKPLVTDGPRALPSRTEPAPEKKELPVPKK